MAMGFWYVAATPALVAVLAVASAADLCFGRRVPLWLTLGAIGAGIAAAALTTPTALQQSVFGGLAGGLLLLPFVLAGGIGGADALLLAAIGAWHGWPFLLATACWTALTGGVLGVLAWRRGERALPYAPVILLGVVLALVAS